MDKQIAESTGLLADLNQMTDNSIFGTVASTLRSPTLKVVSWARSTETSTAPVVSAPVVPASVAVVLPGLGGLGTRGTGLGASGYGRGSGFYGKRRRRPRSAVAPDHHGCSRQVAHRPRRQVSGSDQILLRA